MILVDTSVWIDFVRGNSNTAVTVLHALISDAADLCIADTVITEFLRGVVDDSAYARLRKDLLLFPVLTSKGLETHLKAADIYRACRGKGKTIRNSEDCLIAAIAMENDVAILHNDSDFKQISDVFPGLRLVNPANHL